MGDKMTARRYIGGIYTQYKPLICHVHRQSIICTPQTHYLLMHHSPDAKYKHQSLLTHVRFLRRFGESIILC